MIILVDANTYSVEIDDRLKALREEYFRVKWFVRNKRLGSHIIPKAKTYSIGLLRIATILKENGYDVIYTYLHELTELLESIDCEPDIIAFSAVCPTVPKCSRTVDHLRKTYKKTKYVLGGAQLNVAPVLTKELYGNFDIYSTGYDIEAAKQIVLCDSLHGTDEYVDFSILPYALDQYAINTCSTLGCPFKCNYCQDGMVPYNEVCNDGYIRFFKSVLPPKYCVHFFDSVLGGGRKRLLDVCNTLSRIEHDFLLSCDIRAEFIDVETIRALESAGFVELRLGIESADDDLLKYNNRSLMHNDLLDKVQLIRDNSNIYITLYSAIGFPGTTPKSIDSTNELFSYLLVNKKVDEIKNCIFVPYPFDKQRFSSDDITIIDNNWEHYDRQSFPVYNLRHISADDLWESYLQITKTIIDSWIKGCSLQPDSVIEFPIYGEYIVGNYLK